MSDLNQSLKFWISQFIHHLKVIKHSPVNTVDSYKNDLTQYFCFLQERYKDDNPELEQFNKMSIRGYLSDLVKNGYSSRSIARKLAALRTFAKYLLLQEILEKNPTINIATPKLEKRLPDYLTKKEMQRLLDLPDTNVPEGLRDLLMLKLFYATGLRVSELASIKKNQVDIRQNTLRVTGKGNKTRVIPLGNQLIAEFNNYFDKQSIANDVGLELNDYIFVNKNKEPFTRQKIASIVRSYVNQVADSRKAHPHALRHTFATHLLDEGADLMSVKELLGHNSLSSTQVYTHVSAEHLRRIYKTAHPRAKD